MKCQKMLRFLFIATLSTSMAFSTIYAKAQGTNFELTKVVIDPGHGGRDPGATVGNVKEKDIVLDVSLRAGKLIKEIFPQVEVIYTRNKDVFVPLADRAEIANKSKADLFISIHCNSFHSSGISGAETYILGNHRSEDNLRVAQKENAVILLEDDHNSRYEGFDPNSAESYIMFELIQNEFLEQSRQFADHLQRSFVGSAMRHDRGVRQAGFLVLRQTTMPSVLVELGFISNKTDQSFLISEQGKNTMAKSIADAFTTYKNRVDSRSNAVMISRQIDKNVTIEELNEINESKPISDISKITSNGEWYAVQIMASRTPLTEKHNELKKILPAYYHFDNEWYRYFIGVTPNLDEGYKNQDELKQKFNGAFLVKFVDGKRDRVVRY